MLTRTMLTRKSKYARDRFGLFSRKTLLMSGVASLATIFATPALAQDDAQGEAAAEDDQQTLDQVVVRGIRRSLQNAQDIKQNADTFVDAITAEDISSLSDRSVAEALQRVPGVAVSNFAGPNDPDHFSVEGSGVVIRGLTFTRSELNGRDIFTTGLGRSLNFQEIPSELVGAIEVFKNLSADQIEGGIAGTVNLKTRKPFDSDGRVVGGSVELNYSDLAQGVTPAGSLLLSDRWNTGLGEFGILLSGSFSSLNNQSNGTQIAVATNTVSGGFAGQINDLAASFGGALPNTLPGGDFAIIGGGVRNEERQRERYGFDAALQWRSPDERTTATFEFFRTDATLSWAENVIEASPDSTSNPTNQGEGGTVVPVTGTILEVDEDGQFLAGVLTSASAGWRGTATQAPGSCPGFACGPESVFATFAVGTPYLSTNRGREEDATVNNFTFNIQHEVNDRLRVQLDAQYIESNQQVFDAGNSARFYANTFLDFTNGSVPDFQLLPTFNVQTGSETILPDADGNLTAEQEAEVAAFFADGNNYFFRSIIDHIEDHDTDEFAIAGDVEYDFNSSWLESVKFGVRYSDRDQLSRSTVFNWGVVNEIWAGDEPTSLADLQMLGDELGIEGFVEAFDFEGHKRGNVADPGLFLFAGDFFRSNGSLPGSPLSDIVDQIQLAFPSGTGEFFNPLAFRNAENDGVTDLIAGTPFRQSEISDISEETIAGYVLFNYATGPISGNFGVRYVNTNVGTSGFLTPALIGSVIENGVPVPAGCADPSSLPPGVDLGDLPIGDDSPLCTLSPAEQADVLSFFNGSPIPTSSSTSDGIFLPSFNMKYDLGDGMLLRFAASRAISRPDFALFRNNPFLGLDADPETGELRIRSDGGNPFLQPIEAIQLDGSFEWYFSDVGSLTLTGFWKSLDSIIQQGESPGAAVTNNGVTFVPTVIGPSNSAEGNVRGFELGYRQFYNFLPGPLQHFGFEGTYTFVDQSSIPNAGVEGGLGVDGFLSEPPEPAFPISQLQGLSRHTINATGIYENDFMSLRLAYNWRSSFLLTERDVIFPNLPIFNASQGSLDASLFFNIGDNVKLGVQGVNLTNRTIETLQQINDEGDLAPRSFFSNDRRVVAALRFSF